MSQINNNIEFLSEYTGTNNRIDCRCKIDGHEWSPIAYNLLAGKGCKICHFRKLHEIKLKPTSTFIEEMKTVNDKIEIIGEYTGAADKIECKCLIHDEIFFSSPTHLLSGENGCPKCIEQKLHEACLKTQEQFEQDLINVNSDIKVIGEYTGAKQKVHVFCKLCKNDWWAEASSLLSGCGCPKCASSKGEKCISKYLLEHNITFENPKKFDDLKGLGGLPLSYDFYIEKYNLLIEYQGQFHDGTANIQTEDGLKRQQAHDKIKKEYVGNNNFNFLEIWYWDYDNIETILDKQLNDLSIP